MSKTIISRNKSEVIILTDTNELWLTHRKKMRRTSRRNKWTHPGSVKYIPIKRIPKRGDWLFTCSMQPEQFDKWYDTEENDFCTIKGSDHSRKDCSLSLISTKYAEFFLQHKLWELYDINYQDFKRYEEAVKQVCQAYKIKFEGI